MGTKSKFFRAFVEGQTISDGRKVTAQMIDEVVDTFSTENYTPRINIEHVAGYSPEPPFNGYGDVCAVKAQTDELTIDGKVGQYRALYLQVDGNAQLVKLSKADQKPFPSVELTESYSSTGKVGLIGLAFTDRPASMGTQRLQFSRSAPGTLFASADEAVALEFDEAIEPVTAAGLTAVIAGVFSRLGFKAPETDKPKDPPAPPAPPANDNAALYSAVTEAVTAGIAAATKPINETLTKLQGDFTKLQGDLAREESTGFSRPPATGAKVDAQYATDC